MKADSEAFTSQSAEADRPSISLSPCEDDVGSFGIAENFGTSTGVASEGWFGCFARSQLVLLILPDCKMLGLFLFQLRKHQVNRILKFLVILPNLHGIDELNEGGKVLLLHRGFIVDVADERRVQQGFCLDPEIVPGFALALGVGDEGS